MTHSLKARKALTIIGNALDNAIANQNTQIVRAAKEQSEKFRNQNQSAASDAVVAEILQMVQGFIDKADNYLKEKGE